MKKMNVILSCFGAAVAIVAAGTVATLLNKEAPMEVGARNETYNVYLNPNSNWKQAGARFAAYAFTDGESQWYDLAKDTVGNETLYGAEIPGKWNKIIFCRMNPNTSTNDWEKVNIWNQTSDLNFENGVVFTLGDGWNGIDGMTATSAPIANWDYDAGFYVLGKYGECNWDVAHATLMSKTDKADAYEVSASVSLAYGETFKIAYYRPSTGSFEQYHGYEALAGGIDGYCFGTDKDSNFVSYASGTYSLYYQNGDVGTASEWHRIYVAGEGTQRNAEQLAAKVMSFGDTEIASEGLCDSRFLEVNQYYVNKLSPDEQAVFQGYQNSENVQFANAYARYTTWADILGVDPWEEMPVGGARRVHYLNGSPESAFVVIGVAFAATIATAALLINRRRKKQNR